VGGCVDGFPPFRGCREASIYLLYVARQLRSILQKSVLLVDKLDTYKLGAQIRASKERGRAQTGDDRASGVRFPFCEYNCNY
jgi:hypothetical protein